jgi:hypothetical protein
MTYSAWTALLDSLDDYDDEDAPPPPDSPREFDLWKAVQPLLDQVNADADAPTWWRRLLREEPF